MAFTSDLTIDEVLLIEEVGFEPVDLVLGSSYFHIGWQYSSWSANEELTQISAMMLDARHTAMARMMEQTIAAKADGVLGLRLEIEREGHNAEFTAIGTAVRRRKGDGVQWRRPRGEPFSCDLSGADFWALVRGGFRPMGLSCGVCVYHVAHQGLAGWFKTVGNNVEMPTFTQALYEARELAMGRMQAEAWALGGTAGLVGVTVEEGSHGWDSHVIEYSALGTAIVPIGDPAHEVHESPTVVLVAQDWEPPPAGAPAVAAKPAAT
jgi:uncharacterized protein YbjQ (UPF0145 family)